MLQVNAMGRFGRIPFLGFGKLSQQLCMKSLYVQIENTKFIDTSMLYLSHYGDSTEHKDSQQGTRLEFCFPTKVIDTIISFTTFTSYIYNRQKAGNFRRVHFPKLSQQ